MFRCAPESLRRQIFSSASDAWMYAVTIWELFSFGEEPWFGLKVNEILDIIENQHGSLTKPHCCPQSVYDIMKQCWNLRPEERPSFKIISQKMKQCRPLISKACKDHKQPDHLGFVAGDTISVIDGSVSSLLWRGQNHRTMLVGLFPRLLVDLHRSKGSEDISWPITGSFFHTGHSDARGGKSWGT
ncbi:unnamed protein product, partial [Didymodactylos carnosus]